MAVKAKGGLVKTNFKAGKPKKSKQGHGKHSKPRHNRKIPRGQGK